MLAPHGEGSWRPTVNLHTLEMKDFRNGTVVKVGNISLFPGQIVHGSSPPLTCLILPTAFEYLHNIGWQRRLPPWG